MKRVRRKETKTATPAKMILMAVVHDDTMMNVGII
jgi:hypothetical protein